MLNECAMQSGSSRNKNKKITRAEKIKFFHQSSRKWAANLRVYSLFRQFVDTADKLINGFLIDVCGVKVLLIMISRKGF